MPRKLRLRALVCSLAISAGVTPTAQAAPGDVAWLVRGKELSILVSVFVSPDGEAVYAADDYFGFAAMHSSSGALICRGSWRPGKRHEARSWALSPDGTTLYATGSTGMFEKAFMTVAYDAATCDRRWIASMFRKSGDGTRSESVTVSPDGGIVFVTGTTQYERYATVAYEASTGEPLWVSSRWNRRSGASAYSLAVDPGGEQVYVTGVVGYPSDLLTVAYDTADGEELWTHRFEGGAAFSESPNAIITDGMGDLVFVVGSKTPRRHADDSRILTIAYAAATGEVRWAKRYDGSSDGHDYAVDVVAESGASRVIVTGASEEDVVTVAYDSASGRRQWIGRYDVLGLFGEPNDMALHAEAGTLYVLSTVWGEGEDELDDFLLLAYDSATGTQDWEVSWGGAGDLREQADALAVDPGGDRVYVGGSSADGEGSYDRVVIAFATH